MSDGPTVTLFVHVLVCDGCADGRTGPHKGHSVNHARESPLRFLSSVATLTEEDMVALAAYLASLAP
jgi:hypothetical protein